MTASVYITAMEPRSGKSVISLGLLEMLSSRVERIGFFRPIVPSRDERDLQIELVSHRYQLEATYDDMHALSVGEANELVAAGAHQELEKRVLTAYKALERRCDFIVCEGTDFAGATPALDFELNANLANQLGCPVLVVVKGNDVAGSVAAVRVARESLAQKGCSLFGVVVNRVAPELVEELSERLAAQRASEPVYVVPERAELACPTVGEVASALDANVVFDSGDTLDREVRHVTVAAMSVEHFIEDLVDGTLVIVPADRPDILVASLASTLSPAFPAVAAILLAGGQPLGETAARLLGEAPFPVLEVPEQTYAAATAVNSVRPVLRPDSTRKIASALGVFEASIDRTQLQEHIRLERPARMTPIMFEYELIERAKADRRHIVLPEGHDDRVLRAADVLLRRDIVSLTILGDHQRVRARSAALGVDLRAAEVVDPLYSPRRGEYANNYYELRKHKGMTEEGAWDVLGDPSYFGTMLVHLGAVDGMVSGAAHTTGDTIRPALEFIRGQPGISTISSVFFMCLPDRVLVYGDCAVNPTPDSDQLADIAISSAESAAMFGIEPRVAMLSYSTGDSGRGAGVEAVREATRLVRDRRPDLKVEGPIQYDAAVDASVARLKLPGSEVAGQATVFIFPDLDTGNVAYKAVQRSANAVAVGPVLQGLRRPVNDLSRGCTVTDIINTVAITAIQAQGASHVEDGLTVAAGIGENGANA